MATDVPTIGTGSGSALKWYSGNSAPTGADPVSPPAGSLFWRRDGIPALYQNYGSSGTPDWRVGLGGLVFDVRAYGAKGDGVTQDHAAIQAAINAAQAVGGTVVLPVGTYLIGAGLTITATVQLVGMGWGSIIKCTAGSGTRFLPLLVQNNPLSAADPIMGVVLRDFKLDGNLNGQLDAGLIQVNTAYGFLVDHVWVTSGGTPGENASGAGVAGIVTSSGGGAASQGVIRGCLAEKCTKSGIQATTGARNVAIVNNISRDNAGNGQTPGIQVGGATGVLVAGNWVYENEGNGIYAISIATDPPSYPEYMRIVDNVCYSNGTARAGGPTPTTGCGIKIASAHSLRLGRIIIANNACYSNGVSVADNGIQVENQNDVLIESNVCDLNTVNGIYVYNVNHVVIAGNLLRNNNLANFADVAGIMLRSVTWAKVSDNLAYDDRTTKLQRYGLSFWFAASSYVTCDDNVLWPNLTGGIGTSVVPTNSWFTNNRVSDAHAFKMGASAAQTEFTSGTGSPEGV